MKNILFLFLILMSGSAIAGTYESGSFKVSQLRIGTTAVYLQLNPAPSGCNGGDQYGAHFVIDASNEQQHQIMVSGLLAAYTSGAKLSGLWFNNEGTCSNTHILNLYMYKFESK